MFVDLDGLFYTEINFAIDDDGLFPLALAVIYGHKMIVQLIAKNRYSMLDQKDKKGWNILHYAARYDRLEILDMLMQDPKMFIEIAADNQGNYPLHIASKYGRTQIVEYLLQNKLEKNINRQNNKGQTAIHFAAEAGPLNIVQLLEEKGADINIMTNTGQSALHLAAYFGNGNTVEYLIKVAGINPNLLLKSNT